MEKLETAGLIATNRKYIGVRVDLVTGEILGPKTQTFIEPYAARRR